MKHNKHTNYCQNTNLQRPRRHGWRISTASNNLCPATLLGTLVKKNYNPESQNSVMHAHHQRRLTSVVSAYETLHLTQSILAHI